MDRKVTSPSPARDDPEQSDGRRLRSQDSRARIVAAMLALVREGATSPGAESVAERAGVGLRTVFRHFKDMDSLYREMSRAIEAELLTVVRRPLRGETWQARVIDLIDRRCTAFEAIAPFKRASDAHRHRSGFLAEDQRFLARTLRAILIGEVPEAVANDPLRFEALDLLMSFEAWNRLRADQGLDGATTRGVLEATVGALIW